MEQKRLMSVQHLSDYLAMPVPTIYSYTSMGKIPAACVRRIGRSLKFEKNAIDAWLNAGASMRSPADR